MSFTREQLRAIYAMAIGYGTEAGRAPYQLTVVTDKNTGKPIGQSGYSVGVIQIDFGQQDPAWARKFINLVDTWDKSSGGDGFGSGVDFMTKILTSNAKNLGTDGQPGIEWMEKNDRKLIDRWLAIPAHQRLFFEQFERPLMNSFLP